jgi:hypothetical protein
LSVAHHAPAEDRRPRDVPLELRLTDIAARAAGRFTQDGDGDDGGLYRFASARALPGGIRRDLDAILEISEELADALNYALWGIERSYARFLGGDHAAEQAYDRLMRCATCLIDAWHELHTGSA